MEQLTIRAHAKINLALDVLNRRPDGYHTVRMIMQSLSKNKGADNYSFHQTSRTVSGCYLGRKQFNL